MDSVIILKPVVSEKSVQLGSSSKYTFRVDPRANVTMIAAAIAELFKVKVKSVNIVRVKGKPKYAGRTKIKRANWKKAIVTLESGQTIKLFEEKTTDAS